MKKIIALLFAAFQVASFSMAEEPAEVTFGISVDENYSLTITPSDDEAYYFYRVFDGQPEDNIEEMNEMLSEMSSYLYSGISTDDLIRWGMIHQGKEEVSNCLYSFVPVRGQEYYVLAVQVTINSSSNELFYDNDVASYSFTYIAPDEAMIGEVVYADLAQAFEAVNEGETIKLITDITNARQPIILEDVQNVTLDFDGHSIGYYGSTDFISVLEGASLKIIGDGQFDAYYNDCGSSTPLVRASEGGSVVIDGVTITCHNNGAAIFSSTDGKIVVDNAVVNSVRGLQAYDGELVVNNGEFSSNYSPLIMANEDANVLINGGKFKTQWPYLFYASEGSWIIRGGYYSTEGGLVTDDNYEIVSNEGEDADVYPYMVVCSNPTGVDAISGNKDNNVRKAVKNGKVIIINNDEVYNLEGRKL